MRIPVAHPHFERLKWLATKQVLKGVAVHTGILLKAVEVVQLGSTHCNLER